ncbi:DUF5696 domain-containing protein [Paenibacillus sp. GCM10027626]|uniref:DUF5696 domain-containing protein n=1 Tax=Paenibacillus sp. GCM10027626 TaxID=3273411 RepID=UPI0036281D12
MAGSSRRLIRLGSWFTAAALIAAAAIIAVSSRDSAPDDADRQVKQSVPAFQRVYDTSSWTPNPGAADAEGFVPVLKEGGLSLSIHPETTQITVRDQSNGYVWRSNPAAEAVARETVKGAPLANLQSPFILEYAEADKTQRQIANALRPKIRKSFVRYDQGLQVNYEFPDLQIGLSVQYELTKDGMKVSVPADSLQEMGAFRILAIGLLPYFGAADQAATDGYLFVPDGPGGIIAFNDKRPFIGDSYNYPIYGNDRANLREDLSDMPREPIRYPVFGLKDGGRGFVSIVTAGEAACWVRAVPAGMTTLQHAIYANFVYRVEYAQRLSKLAEPVKAFQKRMARQDLAVEYRFLYGRDAGYPGMAREYQQYLLDTKQLAGPLELAGKMPLDLTLYAGDASRRYGGTSYVPLTTFEQAGRIVDDLAQSGISHLRVNVAGWQNGGSYDRLNRFPVEAELGGEREAAKFIDRVHRLGGKVLFEDDMVWADQERGGMTEKGSGIRGVDGTVYSADGEFALSPMLAYSLARETLTRLKELGVDGIVHETAGDDLFSDYNPEREFRRNDTAAVFLGMLADTREQLGMTAVYGGNAYALPAVDAIRGLALDTNQDFLVDEAVPFYPMVLHGYVSYSGTPGNLRINDADDERLRAIEYGAIPSFELTHDSPRKLEEVTAEFLFSSQYDIWKSRIVEEYQAFDRLAPLQHLRIVDHEKAAADVFVTTYEDGTQVRVDYRTHTFEVIQGEAPAS